MKKLIYTLMVLFASVALSAQDLCDEQIEKSIMEEGNRYLSPPEMVYGGPDGHGNGVVGAIGGTVDVSALGGATYTIPIQVPEGINGMQPNLSIVYNSQSGNGLLGWGWNLGGISAITRVGSTMYHHLAVYPVDIEHDCYALDGQRLMAIDGTYGANGTEYKTELDGLTKIVSYKSAIDTTSGPAWFKVFTADGLIMEYGNSWDSRIGLQQHNDVCFWLLNRVEDRNGNYMTYHYCRGGANYYLSYINYGGRSDSGQCYSVHFDYDNGRKDVETSFIGKNTLHQVSLLKKITVKHWGNEMERYDFVYDEQAGMLDTLNYYNRLDTIKFRCGGEQGSSYNPTVINWGSYSSGLEVCADKSVPEGVFVSNVFDANWVTYYDLKDKVKFPGDFNGDGYTDFIYVVDSESDALDIVCGDSVPLDDSKKTENREFYLCLNRGNEVNEEGGSEIRFECVESWSKPIGLNVDWIYVLDFNGDGKDDFTYYSVIHSDNYYLYELFAYESIVDETGCYQSNSVPVVGQSINSSNNMHIDRYGNEKCLIGDFIGYGRQDLIMFFFNETLRLHYNQGEINYEIIGIFDPSAKYKAGDFDGDGCAEIWFAQPNHNGKIIKFVGLDYSYTELCDNLQFNYDDEVFLGDFNGDGHTDFLVYTPDVSCWMVYLFKQKSVSYPIFDVTTDMPLHWEPGFHGESINQMDANKFFEIADLDGDGKSDITIRYGRSLHIFYGPLRKTGHSTYFAHEDVIDEGIMGIDDGTKDYGLCVGDFLGQGRQSILGGCTMFSKFPHSSHYGVNSIVDGMGNKTEFQFDYLMPNPANPNDRSFYVKNEGDNYPELGIQSVALPLKGLKKVTTSNVYCGAPANSVVYLYENALVHRMGKGFLGFAGITATSYVGDVRQNSTVSHFSARPMWQFCSLTPESERVYNQVNELVSKTDYTYSKRWIPSRHVFMPVLDKVEKYEYGVEGSFVGKTITEYSHQSDHGNSSNYYDCIVKMVGENTGITADVNIHNYAECAFQTLQHTDYLNESESDFDAWVINRPERISVTSRQLNTGNPGMSSLTVYAYNAANPYLPTDVRFYPDGDERNIAGMATGKSYCYDAAGNVEDETLYAIGGGIESRPMHYEYDRYHYPSSSRNGLDYVTQSFYNAYGEIVTSTDCNGNTTYYWHNDRLGSTNWQKTPDNVYSCEAMRWAKNNDGTLVSYAPESAAYYTWSKVSGGGATRVFYDAAGRELRIVTQNVNGFMIYHDTKYDDMGRVWKVYDPYFMEQPGNWENHYTEYQYDEFNRKIMTKYRDGTYETTQYETEPGFSTVISKSFDQHNVAQQTIKKTNLMGQTVESTDNDGNTVFYYYYSDGKLRKAGLNPDVEITLQYDAAGNRSDLFDPNYGHVHDTYNAFGELINSVSPKEDETEYEYDALGRMTERWETDYTNGCGDYTRWTYCDTGTEKGLLKKIEYNGNKQVVDYFYDNIGRTSSVVEMLDGVKYITNYHYDPETGMIDEIVYPSGYTIKKHYRNGHLIDITDKRDKLLWHTEMKNEFGQITSYKVGNGIVGNVDYHPETHLLKLQKATSGGNIIQEFTYTYDDFRNLASRTDNKYGLKEEFRYDNLNRLEYISMNGIESKIGFDSYGRMRDKMADGRCVFHDAEYGDAVNGDRQRPHAIRYAELNPSYGASNTQQSDITYTMFDKVKVMDQDRSHLEIEYGYDHERISMDKRAYGSRPISKTYIGNCEFVMKNGATTALTYLSGPLGVFAVFEAVGENYKGDDSNADKGSYSKLRYIFKDHLGSWTTITDEKGKIEREQSFDAWGKMRDPYTWREFDPDGTQPQGPLFDRGFTGHEHLFEFGLINMNGRMYDPVMSTFLSVDNYVSSPDFSQAFNRYAYCLNNPLKYTDPDGEFPWIPMLIGAGISVTTNGIDNLINGDGFFKGAGKAALFGGIQGLCSFGIGQVASSISSAGARVAFQTIAHGSLGGVSSTLNGGTFAQGFVSGAASSLVATGMGGLTQDMSKFGQAIGTVGGGALAGGVGSTLCGGSFWDGFRNGAISSGLNHAVHTGVFGKGLMMASITGRTRHLSGPDAETCEPVADASAGMNVGLEVGGIRILQGPDKGSYPMTDLGIGAGTFTASVGLESVEFYSTESVVTKGDFEGARWETNGSISVCGISIGGSIVRSNHYDNNGRITGRTYGIGISIGFDAMPFNASVNVNYGGTTIGNRIGLRNNPLYLKPKD